jgi:hypothetical protein
MPDVPPVVSANVFVSGIKEGVLVKNEKLRASMIRGFARVMKINPAWVSIGKIGSTVLEKSRLRRRLVETLKVTFNIRSAQNSQIATDNILKRVASLKVDELNAAFRAETAKDPTLPQLEVEIFTMQLYASSYPTSLPTKVPTGKQAEAPSFQGTVSPTNMPSAVPTKLYSSEKAAPSKSDSKIVGLAVGMTIAGLILCSCIFYEYKRRRSKNDNKTPSDYNSKPVDMAGVGSALDAVQSDSRDQIEAINSPPLKNLGANNNLEISGRTSPSSSSRPSPRARQSPVGGVALPGMYDRGAGAQRRYEKRLSEVNGGFENDSQQHSPNNRADVAVAMMRADDTEPYSDLLRDNPFLASRWS